MTQAQKITATYLRTKETMCHYIEVFQERKRLKDNAHDLFQYALEHPEHQIVKDFNHWFIMQNDFPYDAIAEMSHMLVTKRAVVFDWRLLNTEEKDELQILREDYLTKTYDVIYENLPSGQTQPGRFHLHLLKLKRTSLEKFMAE